LVQDYALVMQVYFGTLLAEIDRIFLDQRSLGACTPEGIDKLGPKKKRCRATGQLKFVRLKHIVTLSPPPR